MFFYSVFLLLVVISRGSRFLHQWKCESKDFQHRHEMWCHLATMCDDLWKNGPMHVSELESSSKPVVPRVFENNRKKKITYILARILIIKWTILVVKVKVNSYIFRIWCSIFFPWFEVGVSSTLEPIMGESIQMLPITTPTTITISHFYIKKEKELYNKIHTESKISLHMRATLNSNFVNGSRSFTYPSWKSDGFFK